jgi:hypothetical protein
MKVHEQEVMHVGLSLSNPKTFLPLLLFIGFVFALFGKGWEGFAHDSGMYSIGLLIIGLAVFLWFISHMRR